MTDRALLPEPINTLLDKLIELDETREEARRSGDNRYDMLADPDRVAEMMLAIDPDAEAMFVGGAGDGRVWSKGADYECDTHPTWWRVSCDGDVYEVINDNNGMGWRAGRRDDPAAPYGSR